MKGEKFIPTISFFYGITIMMYLQNKEHNPPHVHAYYNDSSATFLISNGELYEGEFPNRAKKMVKEFVTTYKEELLKMWETGQYTKLKGID